MATFALLIWPILALVIFAHAKFVPAIITAAVVPYLLLPEAFAIPLPGLPDLDKTAIISIGLVAGIVIYRKRARAKAELTELNTANRGAAVMLLSLLAIVVVGIVFTVMGNREMLVFGPTVLPAMRSWDAISLIGDLTLLLIPFFIARRYLATQKEHRALLTAFVIAGLFYSLLMLVEIRLSPQLHRWVYGYHQSSFLQHIRDGFRPMVFLQHGLWVGFLMFMTVMAAAGLWKADRNVKWLWAGGWLLFILMISKNLGAVMIAFLCLGIFFIFLRKMQIWAVIAIALTTLTYPALRQAEFIPLDEILAAASLVSEDRAQSLEFRLNNEDQLLRRAFEKPLAGWGGWARDRIYDEYGDDISISEGTWILVLGSRGWIGYVGFFGLLTFSLFALSATARRKEIPYETMALALICAGNLIYMIPNATLTPIGLMCFGALAGFVQFDAAKSFGQQADDTQPTRRIPTRYTRFPKDTDEVMSKR